MEVPATVEMGRKTRDFFEKELRENLFVPTVVLAEFIEIAGARIGEEAAKTRIRVLKEARYANHSIRRATCNENGKSITFKSKSAPC